jgi:ceramide glucosyltransferase
LIGLILCGAYLLHLGLRVALALRVCRDQAEAGSPFDPACATVIQPILGGDPGLARTLEDNLIELPEVTFCWLVDEDDAEGVAVTENLSAQYRDRVRVIVCPEPPEGVNPKLFKLEQAWREVETPALIVLDDDTRLPTCTLAALVDALSTARLSTALPYYRCEGNLPTRLLAQFVNNTSALTYLPMLAFGPPLSINGMAYAIRVDVLERGGGFEPLLAHLTDDLAVARRVRANGGTIRQVSQPVQVETHFENLAGYVRQMHRWFLFALLLARGEPATTRLRLGLLLGAHPLLLWGAILTCVGGGIVPLAVLTATCVARGVALAWLQARLTGRSRHQPLLSLVSELLQPLHLLHAALSPNIQWRSRRYRVYANDRFVSR